MENQVMELVVPTMSYKDLLESQKDLLQSQIGNLEQIVATQCELTGTNPLSQEMAAGALSIKIGKKPRDLLNPKAVKYMQFVFSIKDAISKRETREISAQFGVTVTQVRDFFAGQRSRVRKLVRLSGEKADKSAACDPMPEALASTSEQNIPAEPVQALASASERNIPAEPLKALTSTSEQNIPAEPVPLNMMAPTENEEGASCLARHDVLASKEGPDRNFAENVFRLMRKEESFFGQIKLLEWILRIENPSVLKWFLDEGGIMILATWLSEAAIEEQTSVLRVMLKVLDHLPLRKANPVQMSVVFHSVGRLRFYRRPDISSRSRILLHQWRKQFSNQIQVSKKSQSARDAQDEMLLRQSIDEVLGNESLDLKDDNSEEAQRLLCNDPDYHRKLGAPPPKLLMASGDESNKRRGVLSSHTRERRKVQMVEHPSQKMAVRTPHVAKSTPATRSRPLSADDIQKAKMRAQFMQSKHGKTNMDSDSQVKPELQNRSTSSQASASPSVNKSYARLELEERSKVENGLSEAANRQGPLNLEEPPLKKYKRTQIPWRVPPEIKISDEWHVGVGANSKEVEVQKNRNKRERETFYRSAQEIPSNPREPWDREMDHDDTLTPVIPIEQLPDTEPLESPTSSENLIKENGSAVAVASSSSMPEPDLELLSELLKNPELVFALTSGQGGNLPSDAIVKLLDMIKASGSNGSHGKIDNTVEVSLPSPTPSSDPVPNGGKPDFSRNPFSRQHGMGNGNIRPQATVQHVAHMPLVSLQPSVQLNEQWHHSPSNGLNYHQRLNSTNIQNMNPHNMINENIMANNNWTATTPLYVPSEQIPPYPREQHTVSNSLRARQDVEPMYQYQKNPMPNNYDAYTRGGGGGGGGGPVQGALPAGTWDGRNRGVGRPGYESWSPDNSPSRRHEYVQGRNYQEQQANLRYGSSPMQQNGAQQPSNYRDRGFGGNKRWRDQRR